MLQKHSSILLEKAIEEFSKLPGIGRKTATRLVLYLLQQSNSDVESFGNSIITLKHEIKFCEKCHNISDTDLCQICADPLRDKSTICVVENIRDVMAIESTQQYFGLYHVLGGSISPIDGIGPNDFQIDSLLQRVATEDIKEVILALPATVDGQITAHYLVSRLKDFEVKVSTLAQGIPMGAELDYMDEGTLQLALNSRKAL